MMVPVYSSHAFEVSLESDMAHRLKDSPLKAEYLSDDRYMYIGILYRNHNIIQLNTIRNSYLDQEMQLDRAEVDHGDFW